VRVAAILAITLGLTPAAGVLAAAPAAAAVGDHSTSTGAGTPLVADAGAGRYKDRIVWVNWGAEGARLAGGTRSWNLFPPGWRYTDATTAVTTRQEVSATARLEVTCTMTRAYGQDVVVYRPGTYAADGLPRLYAASGGGGLVSAFAIPDDNADRDVDVACEAVLASYAGSGFTGTRSTQPVPLAGLVVADAESTNATESLAATGVAGTTWRVVDAWPGTCGSRYDGRLTGSGRTLTFTSSGECGGSGASSATAVAFAQGSSSLELTLNGSGRAAAAVGYVLGADYGDAPASYGAAPAAVQPTWSGGTVGTGATNLVAGFSLATMAAPATRLGAQASPNRGVPASADATGDEGWIEPGATTPTPDEDAFTSRPRIAAQVGASRSYSLTVPCAAVSPGTGRVRGWVDWNGDGDLVDAGEASAVAGCGATAAGSAVLTWSGLTVTLAQLGTRTLRVAIGTTDAQVATPTTPILAGEVEDWQLDLVAAVRVTATTDVATMPAGGAVTYTVTVTNASSSAVPISVVDDYAQAWDDATIGTPTASMGTVTLDATHRRLTWDGTLPAGATLTITYVMTTRSTSGGPGDQVMSHVVALLPAAVPGTTAVTCAPGSAELAGAQCARVDLYRPGLVVDKLAYRASDTGFTAQLPGGVQLQPGTAVVWRYVVTNTGSVPLTGVTVTDTWSQTRSTIDGTTSSGGATTLTCPGRPPGTSVVLGELVAGASITCTAAGAVVPHP